MEYILRATVGNIVAATLLAIVAAGLGPCLRRYPALRHSLWLLVLVKLVTPPVWTMPVAWLPALTPSSAALPQEAQFEDPVPGSWRANLDANGERLVFLDNSTDTPAVQEIPLDPLVAETFVQQNEPTAKRPALPVPWATIAVAVWLSGAAVAFVMSSVRIVRFHRLLNGAAHDSEDVDEQMDELALRLGLRRRPRVCWMPGAVSPMVWALGPIPRLILPDGLWKRLDKPQRATLLAHELAHLRRGDHWVRFLELVVTGLYWWFPVVWWTRSALRDAEEQCCDAWVVWVFPDHARKYAEALLETVDYLSPAAPAAAMSASGLGHVRQLRRRLTMIMLGSARGSLHWTGDLFALGLSAALLPLAPTWAQDPQPAPDGRIVVDQPEVKLDLVTTTAVDSVDTHFLSLDPTGELNGEEFLVQFAQNAPADVQETKKQIDEALARLQEQLKRSADQSDSQAKKEAIDAAVHQLQAVKQAQEAERSAKAAILRQLKEQLTHAGDGKADEKVKQTIEEAIRKLEEVLKEEKPSVNVQFRRLDKEAAEARRCRKEKLAVELSA